MDLLTFKEKFYAYQAALIPNTLLLFYTGFKLIQLFGKNSPGSKEQNDGNRRKIIFSLIFFAAFSRCFFEADQVLTFYKIINQDYSFSFWISVADMMPTLLFITLSCFFSDVWHQSYSSFDSHSFDSKKQKLYRFLLICLNLIMYGGVIGSMITCYLNKQNWFQFGLLVLFSTVLAVMSIILFITGKKLQQRTVNFVNYLGREVKSTQNFQRIFIIMVTCCMLKCIDSLNSSYWFYKLLDGSFDDSYNQMYKITSLISVLAFDAIAEPGLFLCLILLLNINASKCEALLSNEEAGTDKFFQQTSFNSVEASFNE